VPHDDGWNSPAGGSVVAVDIASADATRSHLNQDVVGTAPWNWQILDCELPVLGQDQSIHTLDRKPPPKLPIYTYFRNRRELR